LQSKTNLLNFYQLGVSMTFIKSAVAVAALAFAAVGAQAQTSTTAPALTGVYVGGNIGSTKITDVGTKTGFGGYVGYNINPNFAVEAGAASMGTYTFSGVDVDTSNYNVSVVGSFPVAPAINVFGRVGYGSLKVAVDGASATVNSALYGAGVRYNINPNTAIRAEYTRFASDTGTFGVGLQFAF
jgi:outer membrane immunogenic protein